MNQCLYCLSSDVPFSSAEHIIPEGMGNKEIILEKGVVCTKCNNGILSVLDQFVQEFEPVAMMRVHWRIPNKRGKLPVAPMGNLQLHAKADGTVNIQGLGRKPKPNDKGEFTLNMRGRRPFTVDRQKKLVRWIYKVVLGLIYKDNPNIAMSNRFDEIREIILGNRDFHGYVTLRSTVIPSPTFFAQYQFITLKDGRETTVVFLDYMGIKMITNLEIREPFRLGDIPEAIGVTFRF